MNRITKRTWLMGIFLVVLLGGMVLFLLEYTLKSGKWISTAGSPHVFNNGNIGCGTVTDREGAVLLDIDDTRTYSGDVKTRMSTLHWLGDRQGNISAGALAEYAGQMVGFDPVNGVYQYGGVGGTMTLTLSAKVQNAALDAMDGRKGTVAVYNYKTGQVLCALTTPSYDPDNPPSLGEENSEQYEGLYLNRFLQSAYIPGSIFKVVTTAAALENVPDILDKTFTCTGSYSYGTESVTCETAHGKLNLAGALAHSCNCAFAQISKLVGRDNMVKAVQKYQVTESMSFDGVTTARGNYDISDAGGASFAWSCIGQHTDQINPCRYMTFMGTIASGGQGVEPYIVEKIQVGDETTYQAKAKKTDRIMASDIAGTLQSYLRSNVQTIYGDSNFPGLEVCAKSGTSQLGGGKKSNAMFAGFVQNEEYPLAFIVVVENGGYGRAACVPVLAPVLQACREVMDAER